MTTAKNEREAAEQRELLVENITMAQIENPKSSIAQIELPCGYLAQDGNLYREVEVREITGEEEDILASKSIPGARKLGILLARCTNRLGPETKREVLDEMIKDLPVGDRVYLLFAIRMVTLGDDYPFEEKCPECEEVSVHKVLLSSLELKKMPNPGKRIFDVTTPTGKSVRFHIMTGREEERIAKLNSKSLDGVSMALLARLDLIDGKAPNLDQVKKLSMKDRNYLRDQFEAVEGGVETSVEVTCPACGHEFDRELSIDRSFFSPSALLRRSNTT